MKTKNRSEINRIIIEKGAMDHSITPRIIGYLKEKSPEIKYLNKEEKRETHDRKDDNLDKETLRLLSFNGELFKPCPGTSGYICCNYQILNIGTNCPMDCSYCILQAYFNQPSLRIFVNIEEELDNVLRRIDSENNRIFRVGTGEFTDSLALDPIIQWTEFIPEKFNHRQNAVIEFKTKTLNIDGLLRNRFRERVIVSWSLNSPYISSREEYGAPSVKDRLQAARICQKEGYILGFHFDPLVYHKNWEDEYLKTIDIMDRYLEPDGIIWISMGCMRYVPRLKSIIRKRHQKTGVLNGEFVLGMDGKMRYFKPLRIEMYSFLNEKLKEWNKKAGIYLCMESDEIWEKSLGWSPINSDGLCRYLDKRVIKFFNN